MLWSVPREWQGETVFIVAGGPSVSSVDLNQLRRHRVVAINSSYLIAPWADFLVFTDLRWWRKHHRRARAVHAGRKLTVVPPESALYGEDVLLVGRRRGAGVSTEPTRLAWWHTTLTTALNLVALMGATRVGLVGVDGGDSQDGRAWHHDPHPAIWGRNPDRYRWHAHALEAQVAPLRELGLQVLNLNAQSAHRMFPFSSIDELTA